MVEVGEDEVVDSAVSEPCDKESTCSNRYLKAYAKLVTIKLDRSMRSRREVILFRL